ncbi:MAG: DUF4870 domain-containing protein [Phototrophicaceae bacterium]|jgi:uncharacterized Tic20 family protein
MTNFDPQETPKRADEERLSRLTGSASAPEDVVIEYTQRYQLESKRKVAPTPRSYSTLRLSEDERLWGAIVHASVWITFLMAFPTGGISVPFAVFIPLAIYLLFRNRSDFVAFHALQAFSLQLICTVGALAAFLLTGVVWLIGLALTAVLMIVPIVGFLLFLVWILVGIVLSVALALAPLAGLILATIAAVRVYNGSDYRYPYVADWVDRQMAGGLLNA